MQAFFNIYFNVLSNYYSTLICFYVCVTVLMHPPTSKWSSLLNPVHAIHTWICAVGFICLVDAVINTITAI